MEILWLWTCHYFCWYQIMHLLKKYPHSSHSNLAISLGSHIDVYTIIFVIISGHFSISPLLYYYSLAFPPNCTICLSIQLRSRARAHSRHMHEPKARTGVRVMLYIFIWWIYFICQLVLCLAFLPTTCYYLINHAGRNCTSTAISQHHLAQEIQFRTKFQIFDNYFDYDIALIRCQC